MRPADLLRYSLWAAVVATAARNRKEYGVPTAWLTHLVGNTVTLLLPEMLRLVPAALPCTARSASTWWAILRTLDRRARKDPAYASYVAPLALGFILSHPDYSIYHGRWAELTVYGFGPDAVPHAGAAYALARLLSDSLVTLHTEMPSSSPLAGHTAWAAEHVDALATLAVAFVTVVWETSEYLAQQAELRSTGRSVNEINMQWSVTDALTDCLANFAGLLAAIAVRRRNSTSLL